MDDLELVDAHWGFVDGLLDAFMVFAGYHADDARERSKLSNLLQYLYTEAMLHGIKHGRNTEQKGE